MIRPRKNKAYINFLNLYFRGILKLHFKDIFIQEFPEDIAGKPVLMIGNHFSWWDGILINELNRRFFNKDLYVLMLEEELKKNMILNRAGAFSINRSSRSMIETFTYCKTLLSSPETVLLFYPQGEIESMHSSEITFKKGVARLISDNIKVIFYTCLPDYFSNSKPSLYFYFRSFEFKSSVSSEVLQEMYNNFYRECKQKQYSS